MQRSGIFLGLLSAIILAGCEERDVILPGERLDVRDALETRAVTETETEQGSAPISLGSAVSNSAWAQSGVSPFARVSHAALDRSLTQLWATSIGAGDSRRQRLNTDPVSAGGRIFVVDAENVVSALSTSGSVLWRRDLTPDRDSNTQAQGGGLAVWGDTLFVSSGFGSLTALSVSDGAERWSQKLGNTATGAPSTDGNLVYVTSGDSAGWAIETGTGRVRWRIDGIEDVANVAGAPAPAIGDKHVVFSFGTGSIQGLFRQGGLRMWSADILGRRNGVAIAGIDDVTGDPLIVGNTVYAANHSGRSVALDIFTGERLWTAKHGALGPLWPAGGSLFMVSDRNQLLRLDASSGAVIWSVDLPGYKPERNPNRRRDASFANHGPIVAGGRVIVASTDGMIRGFDPVSGALVEQIAIAGGATTRPIVVGGVLYVVSGDGVLHAYR